MYKGQSLTIEQMLPAWLPYDMFIMLAASVPGFLVIVALGTSLAPKNRMTSRVKALVERQQELRGELISPKRRRRKTKVADVNNIRQIVDKLNLMKGEQVAAVQSLLIEAGYRTRDAQVIYAFFLLICPIVFGIIGIILLSLQVFGEGEDLYNFSAPIAGIYLGLKFPLYIVKKKRKKRYHEIQRALSDTLDLMTICSEAGLSLGQTLHRVANELDAVYPEMAEEVGFTATEMGFLPDRNQALVNLSKRVQIEEIRGIVNVLIQTEKYGTPVSQALKVLSAEFREQRMLRAEAKAARLPAIMTVPMITLILPTLFIVIISPAVINTQDAM